MSCMTVGRPPARPPHVQIRTGLAASSPTVHAHGTAGESYVRPYQSNQLVPVFKPLQRAPFRYCRRAAALCPRGRGRLPGLLASYPRRGGGIQGVVEGGSSEARGGSRCFLMDSASSTAALCVDADEGDEVSVGFDRRQGPTDRHKVHMGAGLHLFPGQRCTSLGRKVARKNPSSSPTAAAARPLLSKPVCLFGEASRAMTGLLGYSTPPSPNAARGSNIARPSTSLCTWQGRFQRLMMHPRDSAH